MRIILFTVLLYFFFVSSGFAVQDKGLLECLTFQLKSLVKDFKTKNNFTYHEAVQNPKQHKEQLKIFFKSIDKLIHGHLKSADSHTYFIIPEGEIAGFVKHENHFHLPSKLVADKGLVDNGSYEVMLAHEYGHAIFHHNLQQFDKLYLRNMNLAKEYDEIFFKLNKVKMKNSDDPLVRDLQDKLNKFDKQEVDIAKLDTLFLSAFHELFADMIAVIRMNDLEAMTKLVTKTSLEEDGLERSFKHILEVKGWDYEAPYFALAPTRSYIGNVLIKQGNQESHGRLIKIVFDAMVIQLKKSRENLFKQYEKNPNLAIYEYELKIEEMNQGIIDAIKDTKSP